MALQLHFQVGTMNLFVAFKKPDGTVELVTPPLDDVILPGVVRDRSVREATKGAGTESLLLVSLRSDALMKMDREYPDCLRNFKCRSGR